jgi:arylsulfatase A-like enzyme
MKNTMNMILSRREFLKLGTSLPLVYSLSPVIKPADTQVNTSTKKNVLIILFDAFSAYHIPFHGYPRETTPNLNRLLDRATVYHNHISGGNFTYPGVASLLTGTFTWTSRAFNPSSGFIKDVRVYREQNIFGLFDQYYRFVYTHNLLAFKIIRGLIENIDGYANPEELFIDHDFFVDRFFSQDDDTASVAWLRGMRTKDDGTSYSLLLSSFYEILKRGKLNQYEEYYPRGIPFAREDSFYLLEDATDWTSAKLNELPQPFLSYFHFFPPHAPYHSRIDFVDAFKGDHLKVVEKPRHIFARDHRGSWDYDIYTRRLYDEFILFVDHEFGRLFNMLEKSGILENTWVIFTSDHGELFERGYRGHTHESLHQPVIQVPLLIFEPGQNSRRDVFVPTSAIDILPTILHLTEQAIPDWCEGKVLPPFRNDDQDHQRSVFALEAKRSPQFGKITPASAAIIKGDYKLTYYYDYPELKDIGPITELYNLKNDPEELNNLADEQADITAALLDELISRMDAANEPYLKD